ncbi:MAG: AgmX/PglI C-terminal domain-containing protein [Myxococcales bacterium]|nr:AgmX/PglI C-terminal domain-containing protein [Myxococcales bacterium]
METMNRAHDEDRYVPIARAPLADADALDAPEEVLEVRVSWGDDVLLIQHVRASERFVIGEGKTDWLVGADILGASAHVLVEGGVVHAPSAATPREDARGQLFTLGDFEILVRKVHAGRAAARGGDVDRRPFLYVGGAMALAGLMVVGFSLVPPRSSALSLDRIDTTSRLVQAMMQPVATEEPEVTFDTGPSGGEGQRHDGEEGAMGDPETRTPTPRHYGVRGPRDNQNPEMARERLREQTLTAGALGALRATSGSWDSPTSPYGAASALGADPMDALGALMGADIGAGFGALGLGRIGTGRGAGGDGRGTVGLDSLGQTLGHGAGATCDDGRPCQGYGRVGGLQGMGRQSRGPEMRPGVVETNGGLSREVIQRVVRRHHNEVKFCYEQALRSRPDLEGRVTTRFLISPSGAVSTALVQASTLSSQETESCISQAITRWSFPAPENGGVVSVTYPFVFSAAR